MKAPAFELLHPKVRQVVSELGWNGLYPVQEATIQSFVADDSDAIIAAPTASGKTEAIALPILSDLVGRHGTSVQALCISPLKALINDQHKRLLMLCTPLGVPVHRWHGDVDAEAKRRLREKPSGIVFITPESLESTFLNYPHEILKLYRGLKYIVVDELHVLLETERGMHVRSVVARLIAAIGHRPRCFGLSATLSDPLAARTFLNRDKPDLVRIISDKSTARAISVNVVTISDNAPADGKSGTLATIAEHLRNVFNNGSYLVFGNSRRTVEELGDHFRGACEPIDAGEPAVALHHGSLSARLRRQTESMLKRGTPTRALCTSSLELGIDIGAVEAVAQIDPPWSVASLVQRLGRSGRRPGSTSNLLLYVRIAPLEKDASLVDLLYPSLLQAIAMVRLLLGGWLEPNQPDRTHLSTLVHQTLSILKETGGRSALALYESLCDQGPFRRVSPADFRMLLSGLYAYRVVEQDADCILFLGKVGEEITSAPNFYAAFSTPAELTVRWGAKELGRLPVNATLKEGECLLLNGRRWLVDGIDWKANCIWVTPTTMKKAPVFVGGVGEIHDRIFQEMQQVLLGTDEPNWLDENSLSQLASARDTARAVGLFHGDLIELDDGLQWFPWVGTRTMRTLQLWVKQVGLKSVKDHLSLTFNDIDRQDFEKLLMGLKEQDIDAVKLAGLMPNKQAERFDGYIDERLLDKANSEYRLDLASAKEAARRTLEKTTNPGFRGEPQVIAQKDPEIEAEKLQRELDDAPILAIKNPKNRRAL